MIRIIRIPKSFALFRVQFFSSARLGGRKITALYEQASVKGGQRDFFGLIRRGEPAGLFQPSIRRVGERPPCKCVRAGPIQVREVAGLAEARPLLSGL